MKKRLLALLLALMPTVGFAAEGGVHLQEMTPDLHDRASLQNGMKLFVNYCMGCHSLEHQRFARAAEDLDMPRDLVEDNLIFSSALGFNDQMHNAMKASDGENWFGAAPPDLTLEARLRGTDWIYSYLLGFYRDPSRPTGVNNRVFPLVAMPNVLESLQGVQEKVCAASDHPIEGAELDPLTGKYQSCETLRVTEPGRLEPEAFEAAVFDLTNFLAYVGEPSKLQAQALAPKVLIFIFIFGVIAYLLKREYWRDIH
ncbi:cytochrome c1 [Halomonas organivorans]|uniref:Ubiquinol-cytochrome c reductase cytochrome c1 subunit n=1 Tax=Halomonas organivorans TaxID=257772 RepID=A0A7W5C2L8_9GAMM|nr:cytochrome c1 [Halomonas organivorans]MBB3143214.1 ubiquinol-cytochrome c reductase cytochrome c1 subunit [Halomonas organivorans]